MIQETPSPSAGDTLSHKEKLIMLPGKTLLIGPSRAGKSYFSNAFKEAGLTVVDVDKDTNLLQWRNDLSGETVVKPLEPDHDWLSSNHFTIKPDELSQFLTGYDNVIVFAHCWNIMDVVNQFDRVAYMSLAPDELESRLQINRPDHENVVGSVTELDFFRERHRERSEQARQHGIAFIDATLTPIEFYDQLSHVDVSDVGASHQ
jgi:hypothetical protein